jgi:signal transduction histidine kinase
MLKSKTEQLTLGGFVCSLVILLLLSGLVLRETQRMVEAGNWYAHSYQVLRTLEGVRASVTVAESSHFRYLITNDSIYLDAYREWVRKTRATLQELNRLTSDNAQQQKLEGDLAQAVANREASVEILISAQATLGTAAARALVERNAGRQQMERVQGAIGNLASEEQRLLDRRAEDHAARKVYMQYGMAAIVIILIVTLSIFYMLVHRNMVLMRRTEEMTAGINAELEVRVDERTRELALRSAQLEERTQQLESFSYSVSHDLRAPLRAIVGFAQILSRRHRESLNDDGRHFLDNIVQSGDYMGRLIDDLLDYSRLGRKAIELLPTRLADVFDDVIRSLGPRAEELGATLRIPADLPVVVGDRTLLSQIFSNLLNNALTYRKPGVPVTVAVSWKNIGNDVVISVSDNGIGIASEHFGKIFQVFQRLHGQDDYPGTGIGLAVVKKAVDLQNGQVWVDSAVGVGTKFNVRLPKPPAAPATVPASQAGASGVTPRSANASA